MQIGNGSPGFRVLSFRWWAYLPEANDRLVVSLSDSGMGAFPYYGFWAADHEDAAELHRAATMAKAFASDAFFRIGADAIQVFGGIGYTWEHDIHLFYKRLLTLQHTLGSTTEHLEELARIVI